MRIRTPSIILLYIHISNILLLSVPCMYIHVLVIFTTLDDYFNPM